MISSPVLDPQLRSLLYYCSADAAIDNTLSLPLSIFLSLSCLLSCVTVQLLSSAPGSPRFGNYGVSGVRTVTSGVAALPI
jgi:hypothetical protein